jgi:hypothetical protein
MREGIDCILSGSSLVLKPATLKNDSGFIAGREKIYQNVWFKKFLYINPLKIRLQITVIKTRNLAKQNYPTLPTPLTKIYKSTD